jgi:hypothetical protein
MPNLTVNHRSVECLATPTKTDSSCHQKDDRITEFVFHNHGSSTCDLNLIRCPTERLITVRLKEIDIERYVDDSMKNWKPSDDDNKKLQKILAKIATIDEDIKKAIKQVAKKASIIEDSWEDITSGDEDDPIAELNGKKQLLEAEYKETFETYQERIRTEYRDFATRVYDFRRKVIENKLIIRRYIINENKRRVNKQIHDYGNTLLDAAFDDYDTVSSAIYRNGIDRERKVLKQLYECGIKKIDINYSDIVMVMAEEGVFLPLMTNAGHSLV